MSNKVTIKTDFHTHLLPDLDCSGNPDNAVALIKKMKEAGIENVVLTPHFYPQRNNNVSDFINARNVKIEALKDKLKSEGVNGVALFPAAEVLLCQGLQNMEGLELLCIEGTKNILIEMPNLPWSDSLFETLYEIKTVLGLDIVIAHADRYGKKESEKLIKKGYKIQLNADSLCSIFNGSLIGWVKSGYVYALGSDRHIHSDNACVFYKDFIKADSILSKYTDEIDSRTSRLIGLSLST